MKKIIVALALFICASSATLVASEIPDAKRSLKSAQKELSTVISKRNKAQKKQEHLQKEYEEALAKVTANQDKPKSLAYKDAVKKSEALPTKLENNAQLLAILNRQIDSLQNVVSGHETDLSQVQQKDVELKREEEFSEVTIVEPFVAPTIEQLVNKEDRSDPNVLSNDSKDMKSSSSKDKASAAPKPVTFWGKVWKFIKIVFWSIVGIIILVIFGKFTIRAGIRSSSSGSHKTEAQKEKDAKRRLIASYQSDIARLNSDIARERASGARNAQKFIKRYKIQIAEIRQKIASVKASM